MYKAFLILFLICSFLFSKTQNLVPDPSFEAYIQCPDTASNLCWHPLSIVQPDLRYWFDPNCNSSDYYNVCGTFQCGVPQNQVGYQWPRTGNGYCGFNGWADCFGFCAEYIATRLIRPLEAGKNYCISYWVVSADSVIWASNNLGALFTYDSAYYSYAAIHATPQVNFSQIVTDNTNWTQLYGEFTAQGGETFLIISAFDTVGMDTIRINTYPSNLYNWSYYYIDDVEVYESDYCDWDNPTIPNIITPNGDGINDLFHVPFKNDMDYLEIYNRWGQKIITLSKGNEAWNGKDIKDKCSEGIYYFAGIYRNKPTRGFVQLVR